jgi:hypothetical protein
MSTEDMEKMQEKAKAASEGMLKHLSPELREQAKAAMESPEDQGQAQLEVRSTGKRMNRNGFDCEQYLIEKEEEVIAIWASDDLPRVAERVYRMAEQFAAIFPSDSDEDRDEWELVPGKIPIEVRTYRMSMMERPEIEIQAITGIKETKPPADKFTPPGENEGFTRGPMMEMMEQMMEMMQGMGDD